MPAEYWRVGHRENPWDFPPHHVYPWDHRFDDPRKQYRTIYCVEELKTCLREVLADFRPDTTALSEFQKLFGESSEPFGEVKQEFLSKNALVRAEFKFIEGDIVDIENIEIRRSLEQELAEFLKDRGVKHLDIGELRTTDRELTRILSRTLFDRGAAGIKFISHLDNRACYALFEFRARLKPIGSPMPLEKDLPELLEVCKELGLKLET